MANRTTDDSGNVTVAVPIAISTPICHNWYDCVHRTLVAFDVKHPYTVSVSDLDSINCVPITVAVGTKNIKSPSVIDAYIRCVCPQHTSSSFTAIVATVAVLLECGSGAGVEHTNISISFWYMVKKKVLVVKSVIKPANGNFSKKSSVTNGNRRFKPPFSSVATA